MKVLITGGNGFIGSHLVEELLRRGIDVYCLVRETSNLCLLGSLRPHLIYGDLTQKEFLGKVVAEKDYIYHLAGVKRTRNREHYYEVNYIGTQNLIEACARYNHCLKKFVFVSSLAVCGPSQDGHPIREEEKCSPITDYGKSKLMGEQALQKWSNELPVAIVRPPVVYGPRDRDLLSYFRLIMRGINFIIGNGKSCVSLCYVKDLISGILLAAENYSSSIQIYFIADDQIYRWDEIAKQTAQILGKRPLNIHISQAMLPVLSTIMECISFFTKKPVILNRDKILEASQPYWVCDISKAKNKLGFAPAFTLKDGLKSTVQWYKNEGWL